MAEFEEHRFGASYDEGDMQEGDPALFALLMENAVNYQAAIDQMTDRALVAKWPLGRIDPTLRALFRAAGAEITQSETPPKVVITEFVDIARAFVRATRLNLLYDQLFVKEAGADHPTRWHNDQPYWPVTGQDVVSVWVALDSVDATNGRLEFVRGSHLWDRWFQPETFGPNSGDTGYERNPDYETIPDIEADRDAYDLISWDLEPGDVYVFSAMTLHYAGGNSTADRRRRGYTVRYCGDDVRYDPRVGTSQPVLVEGLEPGALLDSEQCPVVYSA